jgi:hypothetical protein
MFARPSQEPLQAVWQTGSHTGSGSELHCASQSAEQQCAQDARHSPWFGASAHFVLQSCWQLDMQRPMQFGGCPLSSWEVHSGVHVSVQVDTHATSAVATQLLSHWVVSRAAQTYSTETGSHSTVHVSVGSTWQEAAASASR